MEPVPPRLKDINFLDDKSIGGPCFVCVVPFSFDSALVCACACMYIAKIMASGNWNYAWSF